MDDLGQLIIFFMCAAIFGMGSTYLFQCIKSDSRIELGDIVYIIQDNEIKPAKITMIRITEKETLYRATPALGISYFFHEDELGTKAFQTELEASEHIN
jgi:hypothetical protein